MVVVALLKVFIRSSALHLILFCSFAHELEKHPVFFVFSTTRVFILFVLLSFVYVNNNIAHAAAAVASSCRIFLRGECRQLARTLRLATVCARGPEGVKPHKHRLDRKVLA